MSKSRAPLLLATGIIGLIVLTLYLAAKEGAL